MLKKSIGFTIITFAVLLSSCIPQNKLEYLQTPIKDQSVYQTPPSAEIKIKPNDELLINVTSFDDVSFNYFEAQQRGGNTFGTNELSLSSISYVVDIDGNINFPIIGMISLKELSLYEAGDKLKKELLPYFNQPNVIIKFAYKKITVLGEVNYPGYHTYTKDQITIFEALGLARDMTVHGNRKEVILIRTENNQTSKTSVDLTKDDLVFSKNYFLQPNDIIYVKSRNSVKWGVISTPITLAFSTITTALLVLNAMQSTNK